MHRMLRKVIRHLQSIQCCSISVASKMSSPALVAILLNIVSLSLAVNIDLSITAGDLLPFLSSTCIGGDEVGLTNTSVLVEYRIVNTTSSPPSVGEWRYLDDVIPDEVSPIQTQLHDSAADGFQLRLLQLEHGGGGCNCWSVSSIGVDCGVGMTDDDTTLTMKLCSQQGSSVEFTTVFCFESARRARGMITEVYCSVSNNSEPCPGDNDTLLPSGGPALPSHCETSDFRM